MRNRHRQHTPAAAAVRGAVAAMSMSGMRELTVRADLVEATPPEMISDEHAPEAVRRLPRRGRDVLVVLAHWAYGATGGVVFDRLPARIRDRLWAGPAYGVLLWLGFEFVVVPVGGLRFRQAAAVGQRLAFAADHLLYGAVLQGGLRGVSRR